MDWNCLLVDLTDSDLAETWQDKTSVLDLSAQISFAGSAEEAQILLNNGGVLNLVIFADQNSGDVQLLQQNQYQQNNLQQVNKCFNKCLLFSSKCSHRSNMRHFILKCGKAMGYVFVSILNRGELIYLFIYF